MLVRPQLERMPYQPVEEWDVEEVCIWLACIGLANKADRFREEGVDGALLSDLDEGELTEDLDLTVSEAAKVERCLDFSRRLVGAKKDADAQGGQEEKFRSLKMKVRDLECQLEEKKLELDSLTGASEDATVAKGSGPTVELSGPKSSAERFQELEAMKPQLSQSEYEIKRKEILDTL